MRRAFSVAVFARHRGRGLLIRHKRLGVWLPVGGELEPGETPLEAAARELREETALVGRFLPLSDSPSSGVEGTPAGLVGYEEHVAGSKGLHMNFVFAADVDTDAVTPNDEFAEFAWVRDSADLDAPANVHQLLRLALHGGPTARVALARAWLAAFNARDLDGLLALYDRDAVHTSPKLRARDPGSKGEIRGAPALRAWWKDSMDRLPGLRYVERHITAMGDRVFMEYLRENPGEESYVVAEDLVTRGDHIVASHVYHG